jgi:membrane associated rhomboid family serine protease
MNYNFDTTPGSLTLLCIIVAFSALALWAAPNMLARNLLRPYWMLKERTYSTLITSGFIHGDFGHLLFNSLTLFFFGPALERRIGTEKFLALYFIGLVLSSLGTVYKQRNNPDYAALGASGAILAVLFAYIVYYPTQNIYLYFALPIPAVLFAFVEEPPRQHQPRCPPRRRAHRTHLRRAHGFSRLETRLPAHPGLMGTFLVS